MLRVTNFHRTKLIINEETLWFRIKRLTIEQWTRFRQEWDQFGKANTARRLLLDRRPGEEQLTAEEVHTKRWAERPPEERDQILAEERAEDEHGDAFALEAISAYVRAEPDQIYDEDAGRYVTEGADLVRIFGSRRDVLLDLIAEIYLQNQLSTADKKKWLSRFDSGAGSSASASAPGERPEPTAPPAAPEASASSEAVTASPETSPSGATDPSR